MPRIAIVWLVFPLLKPNALRNWKIYRFGEWLEKLEWEKFNQATNPEPILQMIKSRNASVVNVYVQRHEYISSLVRFEGKNIFFYC
jgi:hypothetical protein